MPGKRRFRLHRKPHRTPAHGAGRGVRILDGEEFIKGSILDRYATARALAGVHHIYHLAANPNLWSRRKREFEDLNLGGTEIFLKQAARANVERIIY